MESEAAKGGERHLAFDSDQVLFCHLVKRAKVVKVPLNIPVKYDPCRRSAKCDLFRASLVNVPKGEPCTSRSCGQVSTLPHAWWLPWSRKESPVSATETLKKNGGVHIPMESTPEFPMRGVFGGEPRMSHNQTRVDEG